MRYEDKKQDQEGKKQKRREEGDEEANKRTKQKKKKEEALWSAKKVRSYFFFSSFRVGVGVSSQYVVFAGGELSSGDSSSVISVYLASDIDAQNFVSIGQLSLSSPRRNVKVSVVSDKYFLFIGGDDRTNGASDKQKKNASDKVT